MSAAEPRQLTLEELRAYAAENPDKVFGLDSSRLWLTSQYMRQLGAEEASSGLAFVYNCDLMLGDAIARVHQAYTDWQDNNELGDRTGAEMVEILDGLIAEEAAESAQPGEGA